ncbi:MAG: polynucleotide adenylyltransferase PcnB [Myxococcales bacterium]|nr:polynucleotide adenylyltransferase PcnB [Myxococcales bacterium]
MSAALSEPTLLESSRVISEGVVSEGGRTPGSHGFEAGPPPPVRHTFRFEEGRVDPDALRVVRKLVAAGFEAYIVGGAVRDLLLGRTAKDFDIATSARPEDVKRVFRHNCRIIGRRFRLAHVYFAYGGRTYEVATFRRNPGEREGTEGDEESEDLLIRSDNAFGIAHEDALRRDFTINALFYDHDHSTILDWTSGMADVERRIIRTIGQPEVRFREDPVRILRAIKFAARLGFELSDEVYSAIVAHRDDLARAARPRVFEEVLRLLRGGAARRSIWLAWDTGALAVVLPELAAYLDDMESSGDGRALGALDAIDRMTAERGAPPDDAVLLATLLREPIREWTQGARNREEWRASLDEKLAEMGERLAITRRISETLARLYSGEARLRGGRVGGFLATPLGPLALDFAKITAAADDAPATHRAWLDAVQLPVSRADERTKGAAEDRRPADPRSESRSSDRERPARSAHRAGTRVHRF